MLCGVKVNKDRIMARPGWSGLTAVHQGHVYEIKSTYILQPGPAALTEGIRQIHFVLAHAVGVEVDPRLSPRERVDAPLVSAE